MKHFHPILLGGLAVVGLGISACQPDWQEVPLRLKPLLETLPAYYRPLNRQDTLDSYWAPDSLLADSLFSYTPAYRSLVLMRVRFVPASAAVAAGLDTLPFRRPYFRLEERNRSGYFWDFFPAAAPSPT